RSLRLIYANAVTIEGDVYASQSRHRESLTAYMNAASTFDQQLHRVGRAGALVDAATAVLRLRAGSRRHEGAALSMLARGLVDLEYDRGRLGEVDSRIGLLRDRDDLYHRALTALSRDVLFRPQAAADIALW